MPLIEYETCIETTVVTGLNEDHRIRYQSSELRGLVVLTKI